jgi:cell division protein FtsZ
MEIDMSDGGMTEVFRVADNVLYEATRGISDIIAQQAVVNLDFADVRTVMQGSGAAIMGTGRASGENRAIKAAEQAVRSPLLEDVDIHGSRAVLVYITAAAVDRDDLRGAMGHIQQAAGANAHIFFGFANDESLGDDIQVTAIATGFPAGQTHAQGTASVAVAAEPEPVAELELMAEPETVAEPESVADPEPVVTVAEPAPVEVEAAPESDAAESLAALAAVAGGQARPVAAVDAGESAPEPSETSRRFLDPLGAVKLASSDQSDRPTQASQRFRSSVLGDDKLRPAWERKYVD